MIPSIYTNNPIKSVKTRDNAVLIILQDGGKIILRGWVGGVSVSPMGGVIFKTERKENEFCVLTMRGTSFGCVHVKFPHGYSVEFRGGGIA